MSKEVPQQEYLTLTKDEFIAKYPNLSKEDIDFYYPEKKILDFEVDFIGHRKYESLIQKQREFNNYNFLNPTKPQKKLSQKELSQILEFETRNKQIKAEGFENEVKHWEKLYSPDAKAIDLKEGLVPNKETLYKNFLIAYKFLNGVEFIKTDETIKNIEPIIKYFAYDTSFVDCENLIKKVGNKELNPTFDKGFILIGDFGNGKTSVMKSIQYMIEFYYHKSIVEQWDTSGDWQRIYFKFTTTEQLVSEFEYLPTQEEKDLFFKRFEKRNILFDDLKKEKNASNYGITNVVSSILDKRYNNLKNYTGVAIKKFRTFGTMNYHEKYPNDIDLALQELGLRYGSHIYDRIFEMCNIIQFKGKSQRK